MAFDCYVTICTPLHHMTILTSQVLVGTTLYIIMCPNLLTLPVIYVIYCLCFCQFYIIIPQTYCEHMGTAKVSCGDFQFSSVQFSHCQVQLFAIPWTVACWTSLFITSSWSLYKLTSIESVIPSNYLILCYHHFLLPSIFASIRVFSNESVLHIRCPKYWSFNFSISPCNEYSGLTSFTMDWFYLLAVQGTLKSPLQHHSSETSILWCSTFFIVQLSFPYMTGTTILEKTIALTRWTFVRKVMSLLFNMLSRLVIAFLTRNKHLLISWLQSPSAVIMEPKKIKVCHCFYCFPIYLPWSDGTRCHGLHFLNVEF